MAEPYSSPLAERLLRRGTDPIGVVDVRPAVERYERASAWPRRHLEVVERPVARARLDAQAGQPMPMTLAAAGSIEPARDLPSTTSSGGVDGDRHVPSAAPVSLMRAMRQAQESAAAARRGAGEPAARSAAPRPAALRATPPPTTVVGPAMHAVSRVALDRRAASTPASPRRTSDPVVGQTQSPAGVQGGPVASDGGSSERPPAPVGRDAVTEVAPASVAGPLSSGLVWAARSPSPGAVAVATPSVSLPSSPLLVQRRVEHRGMSAALPALDAGRATPRSYPKGHSLEVDRSRAEHVVEGRRPGSAPALDRVVAASGVATTRSLAPTAGPVGPLVARAFTSTRQAEDVAAPAAVPGRVSPRDAARAGGHADGAAPAAAEANTGARRPVQMVWRRAAPQEPDAILARSTATSPSARPAVHGASAAALLEHRSASPGEGLAGPGAPAPATRPSDHGLNIEQIAQEVMRRILEQTTIARERMGEPWH